MGCTDSNVVAQNKPKPVFVMLPQPSLDFKDVWLGEIEENVFVSKDIAISRQAQQVIQIRERSLPLLIAGGRPEKLKLPNFAQMTKVGPSSDLYLLTGGINYKLDHIYSNSYLFNSRMNKLYPMPNLKQARYTHSAVFYKNSIYVIGGRYFGEDEEAILRSCQKISFNFNAQNSSQQIQQQIIQSNSTWENIAPLNIKRCSQVSVIYNDRIYSIGGYTGEFQRSTIIQYFQLKTNVQSKWKKLNVELPFGIESSCYIANNSNQVTIFGGNSNSGPLETVLTLNLLQGYQSIHSNIKLKSKKVLHKISRFNDKIYIFGGTLDLHTEIYCLDSSQTQSIMQIKDNPSNKILKDKSLEKHFKTQQKFQALTHSTTTTYVPFKKEPPFSEFKRNQGDEIAYIFGTNTQPFILQLNISVPYAVVHPVPLQIKLHALQGLAYLSDTHQYLLFGGITDSQQEVKNETYLYNPESASKFSRLVAKMINPRYAFGYQKIQDWVYVVGGGSSDEQGQLTILTKCQKLNIKKLPKLGSHELAEWLPICDLPVGLISPMTINYKNSLYVFGGMKSNKQRYQNILKYVQNTNSWVQLNFNFSFGLEASSIYKKSEAQYLIFGGRVVNGDTKNIWALTFINNGQDCVFQERGQMKQSKCLHHVYKPKHQNFIVILGGQKQALSFYDCQSLKPIQSDILTGMKKLFSSSLGSLCDKSLKNYKVIVQQ